MDSSIGILIIMTGIALGIVIIAFLCMELQKCYEERRERLRLLPQQTTSTHNSVSYIYTLYDPSATPPI